MRPLAPWLRVKSDEKAKFSSGTAPPWPLRFLTSMPGGSVPLPADLDAALFVVVHSPLERVACFPSP
jgi:hypothetical protein